MSGEAILVVDDDPTNLKLARLVLESEGYLVRTADDAEQALVLLETFTPRLILMDIQLPGMDGLALTRQLKADPAHRDLRVLMLSAYAAPGDEERARAAGCDGYLTKPVDTEMLPAKIAELLGTL